MLYGKYGLRSRLLPFTKFARYVFEGVYFIGLLYINIPCFYHIYIDIQIQRYIVVYINIYTYYICMNIYDKLGIWKEKIKRENNKREVLLSWCDYTRSLGLYTRFTFIPCMANMSFSFILKTSVIIYSLSFTSSTVSSRLWCMRSRLYMLWGAGRIFSLF